MVTNQAYLFLIFIINGIIIGLLFDFFRILRKSFKTTDIVTYIEDIIFWILTGLIVLYSIFTFNNGEIRLFMFIAIGIGSITYMLFASSYIIKVNVIVINFLKNILKKMFKIIYKPIKLISQLFRNTFFKPISFFIINIRKISINLSKKTQNILKNNKMQKKEGFFDKM